MFSFQEEKSLISNFGIGLNYLKKSFYASNFGIKIKNQIMKVIFFNFTCKSKSFDFILNKNEFHEFELFLIDFIPRFI